MGRILGSFTSDRKKASSRENAKLGGRPRKLSTIATKKRGRGRPRKHPLATTPKKSPVA
jgi:hypothetical protein